MVTEGDEDYEKGGRERGGRRGRGEGEGGRERGEGRGGRDGEGESERGKLFVYFQCSQSPW